MEKPDLSLTLRNAVIFNAVQIIKQQKKASFT